MNWLAKITFPWLLKQAMKMGAKAWGKTDTAGHAKKSRTWMWDHVWCKTIRKMQQSKTEMDDPIIDWIYVNQACCLEDGRAKAMIGAIRQTMAEEKPDRALDHLLRLENMLVAT